MEHLVYNLSMLEATAIINGYVFLDGLKNFYERMKEELEKLGIDLKLKTTTEVFSSIDSDGHISISDDFGEFVLFLDKDKYLSTLLEKAGVRLFNSAESIRLCDDKMLTNITLSDSGIKMPKTIGSPLNYFGGSDDEFLDKLESQLSYPLVAKCSFGSMGSGVRLIDNRAQLDAFSKENKGKPTLYQEYISSSKGVDYRVIVIGGKVVGAMKRMNPNDFRSNIALGGTAEPVTLTSKYIETAEKVASLLNLDYCGVDLLIGPNDEPILCEVNSNAFIKGFEQYTGINVAAIYAKYLLTNAK